MRSLVFLFLASTVALSCGGESDDGGSSTGGSATGGSGGSTSGGSGGSTSGGSGGAGGTAGTGGSVTGGAAGSGGSTTGGSGGSTTGGSGGTATGGAAGSGGTTAAAQPECKDATDCKVFEDCCSCEGVPSSATPPMCKSACTTKKCAALGVSATEVSCIAGRCVKGYECDSSKVVCLSMPPKCPAGEVAQVKGSCWSNNCVPASECANVASCSDCDAKYACVTHIKKPGPDRHCVDIPQICGGAASCSCFGPSVCTGSFNVCTDLSGVKGVTCGCPTC